MGPLRPTPLTTGPEARVGMRVNRQSQIANRQFRLVYPPAIVRTKDREFFHHELGFADGANHVRPGRCVPFLGHALAGVAAPALDVRATREGTATNLFQIILVQPRFTRAVDVVAVVEHETGPVRMPEVFEVHNLHLVSWLPVVDIIDDLLARTEPNEVDIKFVANRANQTDQILVLLFRAVLVTLPVNEPGDFRIGSGLAAYLFSAQT